jgi:hypothetical protein
MMSTCPTEIFSGVGNAIHGGNLLVGHAKTQPEGESLSLSATTF